ncbi:MAG: hypothetical protein HUU35_04120 [Armatimonadetes bacterium]|nr:hypothetical protein [Armatimonadota bacterium]
MIVYTTSRDRLPLDELVALVERLGRQYGECWGSIEPETIAFQGEWTLSLPSFRPFAAHAAIRDLWILASDSNVETFLRLESATRGSRFPGTPLSLFWARPDGALESPRWGRVDIDFLPDTAGVGIDLSYRTYQDAAELLPRVIEAGELPLEVSQEAGKVHLRHRHDASLLSTPLTTVLRPYEWLCLLPDESPPGLVRRAERIVELLAEGPRQVTWILSPTESDEADDAKRLALWELIATGQFPAREYGATLDLALTDLATLDALRSLPGRWSIRYWLGTANRRDEDGMPLGADDDPMAPRFINVGIETSRAGHRLLLESDAPFDLAALSALTGLSFQKWR